MRNESNTDLRQVSIDFHLKTLLKYALLHTIYKLDEALENKISRLEKLLRSLFPAASFVQIKPTNSERRIQSQTKDYLTLIRRSSNDAMNRLLGACHEIYMIRT